MPIIRSGGFYGAETAVKDDSPRGIHGDGSTVFQDVCGGFGSYDYRLFQRQAGNSGMRILSIGFRYNSDTVFDLRKNSVAGLRDHQNIPGLTIVDSLFFCFADTEISACAALADPLAGDENITYQLHFQKIGGAGNAERHSCRDDTEFSIVH